METGRPDQTTTYDGEDGVPVGGFFNRLLYAVKFGEPNFVLSNASTRTRRSSTNATPRSEWRRSPLADR